MPRLLLIFVCSALPFANTNLLAQSTGQLPSPTSNVSDFAGVVEPQTKVRLETLLQNLKEKTKVEFYIVTLNTTDGRDIFDFSRQLSLDWNIGSKNNTRKSLLLVLSVESRTSFTQFSRAVQSNLPEGILGEMSQRMRGPMNAGRFSEAVELAVQLFINGLGQKLGFVARDLENQSATPAAIKVADANAEATLQPVGLLPNESAQTRPRVVKENSKPAEKEPSTPPPPSDATSDQSAPGETRATETKQTEKIPLTESERNEVKPTKPVASQETTTESAEDETETVELTLTLPLASRAEKLKAFLESHPESKAKPRATELLISTHAGLGDQYLKSGDIDNGIKQLMLAIEEADVGISDKLFSGVISQIPSNLYLRGQSEAAFKAASSIEAKFGTDPNRLLKVAGFYLGLERGDEAARIAEQAVKLAPESAEAHRILALGRHMNLQLDEAAIEYKRAIELDPTSRISRSSLADLSRASGKAAEALVLYDELLASDQQDRAAITGRIICLFDLGRMGEATTALDAALASEPKNLSLLSGVAYWFAAHADYEKALTYARRAVEIEPRYTWAQIALVRSLIGLNRPVGAERAMRYARQFGKFPTLDYELANVVATMGFYDEAAEILRGSFAFKDGQIETYLAGRIPAHADNFSDLLAPERRASIYQTAVADSPANSQMLKHLLALDSALTENAEAEKLDEVAAVTAARDFGSGNDSMRTFRQLYAANRLLKKPIALQTALELVEEARKDLDAALNVSVATTAVQADEFRNLRALAIAGGNIPDIADAPRSGLSNIIHGRVEDLNGWILFNQNKYPEAIEHLKLATATLPNGTPAWRNALWHLGVAYEQTGNNEAALNSYIESYNAGQRDPIRRSAIEKLYRMINGSVDGLDDKIGAAIITNGTNRAVDTSPGTATPSTVTSEAPAATPQATPETTAPAEVAPAATAIPEPSPTATPAANDSTAPSNPEPVSEESLRTAASRLRSSIKITGRVLDASRNGLPNVVVVLISPSGSVLASTTDNEGSYSFTVTPSQKTYRLIPSKDGYTFAPIDKTFAGLIDDQKGIDFVGSIGPQLE